MRPLITHITKIHAVEAYHHIHSWLLSCTTASHRCQLDYMLTEREWPEGPVDPVAPCWPTEPWPPIDPGLPMLPWAPWSPWLPARPLAPVSPMTPTLPLTPISPVNPVGPVNPVAPCGPGWPVEQHQLHWVHRLIKVTGITCKKACDVIIRQYLSSVDGRSRRRSKLHNSWSYEYTRWAKKRGHRFMTIILSIPNRFKNVFTRSFLGKYVVKRTSKIPSHLANVATLPCETLMSAKQERDCFVHYLRLLALCWPSVQVHETITFLLVTLPNIYRF